MSGVYIDKQNLLEPIFGDPSCPTLHALRLELLEQASVAQWISRHLELKCQINQSIMHDH